MQFNSYVNGLDRMKSGGRDSAEANQWIRRKIIDLETDQSALEGHHLLNATGEKVPRTDFFGKMFGKSEFKGLRDYRQAQQERDAGWKEKMARAERDSVNADILARTGGRGPTFFTNPKYGNVKNAERAYQGWKDNLPPEQAEIHRRSLYKPEERAHFDNPAGAKAAQLRATDLYNPKPQINTGHTNEEIFGGAAGFNRTPVANRAIDDFEELPKMDQAKRLGLAKLVNNY
jgi:hypothetical protein